MNRLYTSNRNELLCEKLAENIKNQSGSIFQKTMIITQSGGMNDWLIGQLTRINTIFSHYEFQNQDGFMGQVFELLTGEPLRSNRDAIKFGVYGLLDSKEFKKCFHAVASYYQDNDLRRIQLAEKIADLFDQYQLYRVDMIKKWENGERGTTKEAEKWQMWLWQQLNLPSKESYRKTIYDKLEEDSEKLQQLYPEIHLFGITIFTGFHLEFYQHLEKYIKVNYYLCLPSQSPELKNSMLESNGTKARELLYQCKEWKSELADFNVGNTGTLLVRLQQSILNNEELDDKNLDESIEVTSHYTPVREVETLYNYLLDLFEKEWKNGTLKPHDVMVITPDINKYEPFIKAVFRNAPVKLPFRVSGAARNTGNSICAAMELIVNITEEDLTAEKVAGLLEQNRIGMAYKIESTSYIRGVLNKAGIRFGRENRLEDDTHFVSWKYGFEKIILGYAMHTDEAFDVSYRLTEDEKEFLNNEPLTNYPYKDAEASASYDLLRLKAFVDDLQSLLDEQQTPRTLSEWIALFQEKVMGKMVWSSKFGKDDKEERKQIMKALGFVERLIDDTKKEPVPWAVFLNELKKRVFTESAEHNLNSGNITFASAIPVRGLPYKVIAFIGLDNGIFPRQDHHLGFDLMGNDYQPGDRSKKEADKSLFLDTIMAAREKLYLSYTGRSVKDNTKIPPSIVLDTLMDYLAMKPVQHPLHGFSKCYNYNGDENGSDNDNEQDHERDKERSNKKLFTYLYNSEPDPRVFKPKKAVTAKEDKLLEINVKDFVSFFEAPIDWYFKKELGIYYDGDKDDTLPETELFNLDHLQQWQMKNDLLKLTPTSADELSLFTREHIRKGQLPLKNIGRKVMENLNVQIEVLRVRYQELTSEKKQQSEAIDLPLSLLYDGQNITLRITGTIDGIFNGEYLYVSTSTSKDYNKHRVRAFLYSLLLYAEGKIESARLLGINGSSTKTPLIEESLPATEKDEATDKLTLLAEYLIKGKQQPLIFSLKACKYPKGQNAITIQSVMDALKDESSDGLYTDPPVPGNKYILKLMEEGYFDDLTEKNLEEINALAELLNL